MSKGRNEQEVLSRNCGMRYVASYTVDNYVEYEGFALDPAAETSEAKWQICKHGYDANKNLTSTTWAKPSGGRSTDDFIFIWDNKATYF